MVQAESGCQLWCHIGRAEKGATWCQTDPGTLYQREEVPPTLLVPESQSWGFQKTSWKVSYFLIYFRAQPMEQQRAVNLSALRYPVYLSILEGVREFLEGSKKANTQETTCSQAPQRKSKGNIHPRLWIQRRPFSLLTFSLSSDLCPFCPFPRK